MASLELPDGTPIEYGVNDGVISFILPAGATDGAIAMVAHSGVKVVVAQLGMAVPLNLEATPAEGLRGGDVITIKGTNMELVTTVIFPGVADAQIPTVQSPTEIAVTLPEMATSGDIILNTASGNTTSVTIQTLKPSVSAYNPSPVSAGSDLVIEGENLDLVATVTLGGGKVVEPITAVITAITVTVPVDAESGEVILTMKNGETVTCPNLDVDKPVFCYICLLFFIKICTFYFDKNTLKGQIGIFLSAILATTGQATWFQIGSSTNEIQISAFVLISVYFLLKWIKNPELQTKPKFFLLGLFMGIPKK